MTIQYTNGLRLIENHAGIATYQQATQGFAALPPSIEPPESCWQVLGVSEAADEVVVEAVYRAKAKQCHPDQGGDAAEFRKLNDARAECLRHLKEVSRK